MDAATVRTPEAAREWLSQRVELSEHVVDGKTVYGVVLPSMAEMDRIAKLAGV